MALSPISCTLTLCLQTFSTYPEKGKARKGQNTSRFVQPSQALAKPQQTDPFAGQFYSWLKPNCGAESRLLSSEMSTEKSGILVTAAPGGIQCHFARVGILESELAGSAQATDDTARSGQSSLFLLLMAWPAGAFTVPKPNCHQAPALQLCSTLTRVCHLGQVGH